MQACVGQQGRREARLRADQQAQPRVLSLRCRIVLGVGRRGRDRERVRLERESGHSRHDQERRLARRPAEVWWAVDVEADKVRREELDRGVEPVRIGTEAEIEMVVVDHPREAEETVEAPDEEAWPDVVSVLEVVGVDVCADEQDPVAVWSALQKRRRE